MSLTNEAGPRQIRANAELGEKQTDCILERHIVASSLQRFLRPSSIRAANLYASEPDTLFLDGRGRPGVTRQRKKYLVNWLTNASLADIFVR